MIRQSVDSLGNSEHLSKYIECATASPELGSLEAPAVVGDGSNRAGWRGGGRKYMQSLCTSARFAINLKLYVTFFHPSNHRNMDRCLVCFTAC